MFAISTLIGPVRRRATFTREWPWVRRTPDPTRAARSAVDAAASLAREGRTAGGLPTAGRGVEDVRRFLG